MRHRLIAAISVAAVELAAAPVVLAIQVGEGAAASEVDRLFCFREAVRQLRAGVAAEHSLAVMHPFDALALEVLRELELAVLEHLHVLRGERVELHRRAGVLAVGVEHHVLGLEQPVVITPVVLLRNILALLG